MKIALKGTLNTRDLGGMKTQDGRVIKDKLLIRSDSLFEATEEDIRILKEEYDLKRVIDLRTYNELSEQPPRKIEGVEWIHIPLLRGGQPAAFEKNGGEIIDSNEEALSDSENDSKEGSSPGSENDPETNSSDDAGEDTSKTMAEIFRTSIAQMNYDVPAAMKGMYSHIFSDPYSVDGIRSFFDVLLGGDSSLMQQTAGTAGAEQNAAYGPAGSGATLWHCTAGKDRTGVLTLLLLGTLGVSREDILADYVQSGEDLRPQTEGIISEIRKETDDELLIEQARILNSVLPEYIDLMFDSVEALGGDITGYVKKVVGLSDDKIKLLKSIYLE